MDGGSQPGVDRLMLYASALLFNIALMPWNGTDETRMLSVQRTSDKGRVLRTMARMTVLMQAVLGWSGG